MEPSIPQVPEWRARLVALRARHAAWEHALFFALGFGVDILLLGRIDSRRVLLQQGVYVAALGWLLAADLRAPAQDGGRGWLARLGRTREDAFHFLVGSVLSLDTLFYFKSAAPGPPLLFAGVVFGLMVLNELPRFRRRGPVVRVALFGFCLASYLAYLLPVLQGALQPALFFTSCAVASLAAVLLGILARAPLRVAGPAVGVQALLLVLYALRLVPPVPLHVPFLGVFHQVESAGVHYRLDGEPPPRGLGRFSEPVVHAVPGEKVYVFARIFAPTGFRDQVRIRWEREDERGEWTTTDLVPLTVSGGREDGWGGYAYKQNHAPGRWRVQVETQDGREVGYLTFTLREVADSALVRRVTLWR